MKLVRIMTIATTAVLAACGGGGGGDAAPATTAPVAATASFPLQSAYKAVVVGGLSKNFTISGSCAGAGSLSMAPAATSKFEGIAGVSLVQTITLNYTNCTPASNAATSTTYFDANYNRLGSDHGGDGYGIYATPVALPATVTVGATGTLGTMNEYTNSTKSTGSGYVTLSYVVEADTSTAAIVNFIAKSYTVSNALSSTEQHKFRITEAGGFTPVLIDIQYATGTKSHLIATF